MWNEGPGFCLQAEHRHDITDQEPPLSHFLAFACVHKYWLNPPGTYLNSFFFSHHILNSKQFVLLLLSRSFPPPLQFQRVPTPCFTTHTIKHTQTPNTEKIKKQHVSKRQCISPQSTEPRQWETEQSSRRRPPPLHPAPLSKSVYLFLCLPLVFFPSSSSGRFFFFFFLLDTSSAMTTLTQKTKKKSCAWVEKGRLV